MKQKIAEGLAAADNTLGFARRQFNEATQNYNDALVKAGIKTVYYESPGTSHEWLTWRRSLHQFATKQFSPAAFSAA